MSRSAAWERFEKSLELDLDAWRDGTGYDLAALEAMSGIERNAARELIKARLGSRTVDWRDLEAAQAPGHPVEAVKAAVVARVRKVDAQFIWASMVLLEVFGGAEDAFAERPFLFEVQAQGPGGPLLEELIARVEAKESP